ncbi:hypothetical protein HYDPIDRAFT_31750 [Hydnomerulius pinastri MD-312]|uniref:Unplaced genomic scaffold scaffold_32, whole genome shotgun sequence n=1 Tax=Hydnomerulius pinastri MD-312 TaxID=994086 RepID=A0A0C9WBR5_9AGAM|nr:hypothetical protein HYDPIDRAFT_31750 [Hydnomerulius pinastri MD-312]
MSGYNNNEGGEEEEEEEEEAVETFEGDDDQLMHQLPDVEEEHDDDMLVNVASLLYQASSSTDQQVKIAALKNKCKAFKLQAYMQNKGIVHLEAENQKECLDAEHIHCHFMEMRQIEDNILKEESEVLHLKLELMKLNSGLTSAPSSSTVPGPSFSTAGSEPTN